MSRLAPSIAILVVASAGLPAFAADPGEGWDGGMDFRAGYQSYQPKDWNDLGEEGDGIHFETGLRYWYSMGTQSFQETLTGTFETNDTAHAGEAFLRIEDDATATYAKAWLGYSGAISGDFTDPNSSGEIIDGTVGYAGFDFGYNMFNDGQGTGVGGFVGYNYWNNSPRTARTNFATPTTAADIHYSEDTGVWSLPGDSKDDMIDYHMLRLGLSGKAEFGNFFDLSGEIAAVPYAKVHGILGGHDAALSDDIGPFPGCGLGDPCPTYIFKGSETNVDGWGYGAMAEVMAGFHPTENLTLRLGGRAWYLQGTADATWREITVHPPVEQPPTGDPPEPPDPLYGPPGLGTVNAISTANPFSAFRYGLLAEITYSF
jgi:hypothetical protein